MITITIGTRNDEVIVRGRESWMEKGCQDDEVLERVNAAARAIAAANGWIVDSKTRLYEYRERIAQG